MTDNNLNPQTPQTPQTQNSVPENLPGVEVVNPNETTQLIDQSAPLEAKPKTETELNLSKEVVKQEVEKTNEINKTEQPQQTDLQKKINSDIEEAIKPIQKSKKEEILEQIQDKPKEPTEKQEQKPDQEPIKDKTEVNTFEESKLKPLRTYKEDITKAMNTKSGSFVGIMSAESKKRYSGKQITKPLADEELEFKKGFRKKVGIIVLSTVLVVFGAGSVFYFYGKSNPEITVSNSKIQPLVFADDSLEFNITNLSRRQILNELTFIKEKTNLSLGRIKNIFLTKSFIDSDGIEKRFLISTTDFLNAIDIQVPTSFLRSLQSKFMVGVHVFDGNQPFIILNTSFYENAFAGMLEWERYLRDDLSPFFNNTKINTTSNQTVTNTPDTRAPVFNDLILKNKDARVLKDKNDETILLYSFIDKNTIIITTNEGTFGEILTRLASSRTVR